MKQKKKINWKNKTEEILWTLERISCSLNAENVPNLKRTTEKASSLLTEKKNNGGKQFFLSMLVRRYVCIYDSQLTRSLIPSCCLSFFS